MVFWAIQNEPLRATDSTLLSLLLWQMAVPAHSAARGSRRQHYEQVRQASHEPQQGCAASCYCRLRSSAYELVSICARSSAIEPNLTVPCGSLASIDPSAYSV